MLQIVKTSTIIIPLEYYSTQIKRNVSTNHVDEVAFADKPFYLRRFVSEAIIHTSTFSR